MKVQIEIIGEASGSISEEVKNINSEVPWRVLKDLGNFLIHNYFGVDYNEVFTMIEPDLPELKAKTLGIINKY